MRSTHKFRYLAAFAVALIITLWLISQIPQAQPQVTLSPAGSEHPLPQFTYPNGQFKALILSFDDGLEQDRRLIELFNQYGVKGTFALNSARLGTEATWRSTMKAFSNDRKPNEKYIDAGDLKTVYNGHEIASHSHEHHDLTELFAEQVFSQLSKDIQILEPLTGQKITSHVYPFGQADAETAAVVREAGFSNARLTKPSGNFRLPDNPMLWRPTCHYKEAHRFLAHYLDFDAPELSVFYVWGHSWELDDEKGGWEKMETFLQDISQRDDIWFTTAGELIRYIHAAKQVYISDGGAYHNPLNNLAVKLSMDGEVQELLPGKQIQAILE